MSVNQPLFEALDSMKQENSENEFAFSLGEMKWASEATAECYRRLEKGDAKPLVFRE